VLLLVDLDGVVYRGRAPVPGVAALLADRSARGDAVVYVTNNAVRHREDYVARLVAMGAPVSVERIVTSARAAALHLAGLEPPVGRVLALGGRGLIRELREAGLTVVDAGEVADAIAAGVTDGAATAADGIGPGDAVLVGLAPELTYRSLAVAADGIRAGARFVATNRDPSFPTEGGLRPGAGAVVAAVETTTGVTPLVIGKPGPLLLLEAARAAGADPSSAVMIGDSLVTDIPAGRAVGARTILMLTGVTTRAMADALAPADRPTAIAADADELACALERLASG
jgi:HAD superfamily hydrolase (TIGR01450 family)